jgi:hypothetical protein
MRRRLSGLWMATNRPVNTVTSVRAFSHFESRTEVTEPRRTF